MGYGSVRRDVALLSPPWDEIIRLVNRDPCWHSRSAIHHNPGGKDIRIEVIPFFYFSLTDKVCFLEFLERNEQMFSCPFSLTVQWLRLVSYLCGSIRN